MDADMDADADKGMLDALHRFGARLDYPMYVVTTIAADDGERAGCLVGFVTQCSIHPPRWAVWLSVVNRTCDVAKHADVVAVHALSTRNRDIAELFGHESSDRVDKFTRCRWSEGPSGVPIVDGVPGWFAARILSRFPPTGDHLGFLVEPVEAQVAADDDRDALRPDLGYQSVKGIEPGHDP
jgi:flavin reductase (DIM6/NTAB) family NADH-FMN oxidoreductase RutF